MSENKELIKKNGISKCCDKNIGYFTQFTSREKIEVPCAKPEIERIASVIVDPEIISTRIVNTIKGTSAEGQYLSGKKLCIEIKLNQKVMYVANTATQSMHAVENTTYCSAYIIISDCIEGTDPSTLLNRKLLRIEVFVEEIVVQKLNNRHIDKSVFLLIQAEVAPTYKLCCTEEHNCTCSNLYTLYQDGTLKKQLTDFKDSKVFSPQWSPNGQNIAFLLKHKNSCSLYMISSKGSEVRQLTDPYTFPFVSSFYWAENNIIYFSSYVYNQKEIFSINTVTLEYKQLTYGNDICTSYKPKCSPADNKIAFLKAVHDRVNLYTMNTNGLSTRQLTTEGHVKDFAWSKDCSSIVCVVSKEGFPCEKEKHNNRTVEDKLKGDGLIQVDVESCRITPVLTPQSSLKMRKLQYSPDGSYISFIGKILSCEDIYIYDLLRSELINLTTHNCDITIDDYTWKADSTSLYFSANDLVYFNLYNISLCDKVKTQISNTTADGMQVSYRPRIV